MFLPACLLCCSMMHSSYSEASSSDDIRGTTRREITAVTYNCQVLTRERGLLDILRLLCADFVGLQGTQVVWRRLLRAPDQMCYAHQAERDWVIQWPADPAVPTSGRCAGVAVAFDACTVPRSALRATGASPGHLAGCGGWARVRIRGGLDFCLAVLYPPPQRTPAARQAAGELWDWLEAALMQQPARTTTLVFCDANAWLGPQLWWTPGEVLQVGATVSRRENVSGKRLRLFMQRTHWCAVKRPWTWTTGSSGFFGNCVLLVRMLAATSSWEVSASLLMSWFWTKSRHPRVLRIQWTSGSNAVSVDCIDWGWLRRRTAKRTRAWCGSGIE